MILLLLAAQVVAPAPEAIGKWFSGYDVPQYLIEQDSGLWQVPVRVDVAPDGKLRDCKPETAGRVSRLDAHTCNIIRRRAKFRPASIDGAAAFGVYRTTVQYSVSDAPWDASKAVRADVDVEVNRLPAGLKSPVLVKVAFAVDATGTKSSCTADDTTGLEKIDNHPALVPVACSQLEGYRATPAMDSGRPVVSVQNALVRFSTPKSQ